MITLSRFRPLFAFSLLLFAAKQAAAAATIDLRVAPATTGATETTLIWTKPDAISAGQLFEISCNEEVIASTAKTHFTVKRLRPSGNYRFSVSTSLKSGAHIVSNSLEVVTEPLEQRICVTDFGAVGDGKTLATKAIQSAIDACSKDGTVIIPRGEFLSGALFLKSDMTLLFEEGSVLRGSESASDYAPMIRNRFEGWELDTFASLLNAGKLDHAGAANVHNLRIRGRGTIVGGGEVLAKEMIAAAGMRSRGRLILLMNCENVEIEGLTLERPPAWTLHYVYSKNVTVHDLTIKTEGIHNGDGIDPDSSVNSFIFNCTFDTGDDCVAIKSGKNPEGNFIARVTENVRIMDCTFVAGHGISIGSEISGGVRNVLVEDCVAGNLVYGLQIKATKDRGGFVEDVTVRNCELRKITIYTELPYNNDGIPALTSPTFRNFHFRDIDLSKAAAGPVIVVNGYPDPALRTRDVTFERIKLAEAAVVQIDQAERVSFYDVTTPSGKTPTFEITRSENIVR